MAGAIRPCQGIRGRRRLGGQPKKVEPSEAPSPGVLSTRVVGHVLVHSRPITARGHRVDTVRGRLSK